MSNNKLKKTSKGVTISAQRKLFDLHLRETWKYRDLIVLFIKRDFIAKYKQTVLGPLWAIFQPLLTTFVFTFIFGSLANLTTNDVVTAEEVIIPTFLFYMAGTICWQYFSTCLTTTSNTFISGSAIMGKVYFPRIVMPIATVGSGLIAFAIQFVMFAVVWLVYFLGGGTTMQISWHMALLPLLVLQMAMLGMGFGIIVSSLTTKYRDLSMLVTFGVQLWQYATPVVYGLTLITENLSKTWQYIYMLNPMTSVITTFRYAFFGVGYFDLGFFMLSWAVTIVVLFIGLVLFTRIERTFMDTI